jgi:hypothetical protein
MAELTCVECRDLAAELALNILTGRERASAQEHLSRCCSCRHRVSALSETADQFVELLPQLDPPNGFDQRTLSAFPAPPPPRPRRAPLPLVAVLLTIALAAASWALRPMWTGRSGASPTFENQAEPGARTVLYTPLTSQQRLVGRAYLYPGSPSWIYLSVDASDAAMDSGNIDLQGVRQDGSTVPLGRFALHHGRGTWGGPTSVDPGCLTATQLVNSAGHTVATGRFNPGKRDDPGGREPREEAAQTGATDSTDGSDSGEHHHHDRADREGKHHHHHHRHHHHRHHHGKGDDRDDGHDGQHHDDE